MLLFKYLKASKTNRGRFWFRYIQPKIRINRQSEEERYIYIYPGHQVAPVSLTPPSRPDRKGKTDSPNIKPRLMELLHAFSTNSTVCSLTACTSPFYTAGGAIHAAWGRLHWARCWGTRLWFLIFLIFLMVFSTLAACTPGPLTSWSNRQPNYFCIVGTKVWPWILLMCMYIYLFILWRWF